MKKKLLIAFVVVSMLICVLAACGKTCNHDWQEGTTSATCTEAGKTPMTCSLCGATTTKDAFALGHDYQFVETVKPTCKDKGYDLYSCSRCDSTENRNEVDQNFLASGHNYQPVEVPPTCDKAGYKDNVCTICGNGDGNRETIPSLKHTFEREGFDGEDGVVITDPTCTENGKVTYNCTADGCGFKKEVSYEELLASTDENDQLLAATLEKLGHSFTEFVEFAEPTCTTAGYVINECANGCGETLKEATDPALGHSYEITGSVDYQYKVTLEPTCITEGYKWVVCTTEDCGFCTEEAADKNEEYINTYRVVIEPTGEHKFDKNPTPVAPLCEEQGYTVYSCSADGACVETQNRDFVPALGHEMVLNEELLTNGEPTCITEGNYQYDCTRCDHIEVNLDGQTNNGAKHTYVAGQYKVAATCITPAYYECPKCNRPFPAYAEDTENQPHGNHVYDKDPVVTEPTCSTYGYTTFKCSADAGCTATEDRVPVARLGHTFSVPPTEDGTIVCSVCSAQFINQTTIIWTQNNTLCKHENGETCDTCGIGVVITGTKTPDAPYELAAGVEFSTDFKKTITKEDGITTEVIETGAALIELKGDVGTTYTIKVYDKNGELIAKYDAINGETNLGQLDVASSATGSCIVDITEVQGNVGSIAITASDAATVSFYITK